MDILAQYARTQKCDHCGGCHNTEICAGISPAGISPAPRKRCAACHRGEHTSWSTEYLARGGGKGGGGGGGRMSGCAAEAQNRQSLAQEPKRV